MLEPSRPAQPSTGRQPFRFGRAATQSPLNGAGAVLDEVTGLRNQRVLWKELAQRAATCSASSPLALVVVDFDRLNEVNERYDRSVGDAVMRSCAEAARREAPSAQLAFRYRDDELVLLVPGDEEDGGEVAERVRMRIAAQNSTLPAVTVSCGVAVLRAPVEPLVALGRVGPALQAAKRAGGNRVVLATELSRTGHHASGAGGDSTACRAALAMAVASLEARDQATAAHSDDVVTLCGSIGTRLGLSDEQLDRLAAAAQLHDVGKLAMPTEILNKPGPLDDEEWDIIREHTVIGERMLRAVPEMGAVANMVRHSHESWDGNGYPDGLAGEEIPLASRIILCADAFHAIRSDRPYRPGRSAHEALQAVRAGAGKQFDPRVVEALVAVARDVRRAGTSALARPRKLAALLTALAVGGGGSAYAASEDVRHAVRDAVEVVVPGSPLKPAEAKAAETFALRPIDAVPEIVPVALLTPELEFPELRDLAYDAPGHGIDTDDAISALAPTAESDGPLADVGPGGQPVDEKPPHATAPAPATSVEVPPAPAALVPRSAHPVVAGAPTPALVPVAELSGPAPAVDEPKRASAPGRAHTLAPARPQEQRPTPAQGHEHKPAPAPARERTPELANEHTGGDDHPRGSPPALGNPHGTPPGQVEKSKGKPPAIEPDPQDDLAEVVEELLDELPLLVDTSEVDLLPQVDKRRGGNSHGEPRARGNPHGTPPGHVDDLLERIDQMTDEQPTAIDAIAQAPSTAPVVEEELEPYVDDTPDRPGRPESKPERPGNKPERSSKADGERAVPGAEKVLETSVVSPAPSIVEPRENVFVPTEPAVEPPVTLPPTAKAPLSPPRSSRAAVASLPSMRPPEDVPALGATETPTSE